MTPAQTERWAVMLKYRRTGAYGERKRCACGRWGNAHLTDVYDLTTLFWECKSCELRRVWARRKGVPYVPKVESEKARRRRELTTALIREKVRDPEYRKMMVDRLREGARRARERRKAEKELLAGNPDGIPAGEVTG